jgi:hypothetical protein
VRRCLIPLPAPLPLSHCPTPAHIHMHMHMPSICTCPSTCICTCQAYAHAHPHAYAYAVCRLLAKLAVPPRRWKRPKLPQLAAAPEERVRCEAAESQAAGRGGGSGWRGADGGQVSVEAAAIEHYAARGWPVRGHALHMHRMCTACAPHVHCMCALAHVACGGCAPCSRGCAHALRVPCACAGGAAL